MPWGEADRTLSPLVRIRAEREQMSAIERRIGDFILENAALLRDYSSQQLAAALEVSQSSVVKFSQKLGFKGYPDLKFSIGEALARGTAAQPAASMDVGAHADDYARLHEELRQARLSTEEETRHLNPRERIEAIVELVDSANRVYVCGTGDDGIFARECAMRLSLLGLPVTSQADPILMLTAISPAQKGDVLLMFSEFGKLPVLSQVSRQFQDAGGKVVAFTRHGSNPLRAHADAALGVSARHPSPLIEPLLYRAGLDYLLDFLFVLLAQRDERQRLLATNLERIRNLLET